VRIVEAGLLKANTATCPYFTRARCPFQLNKNALLNKEVASIASPPRKSLSFINPGYKRAYETRQTPTVFNLSRQGMVTPTPVAVGRGTPSIDPYLQVGGDADDNDSQHGYIAIAEEVMRTS